MSKIDLNKTLEEALSGIPLYNEPETKALLTDVISAKIKKAIEAEIATIPQQYQLVAIMEPAENKSFAYGSYIYEKADVENLSSDKSYYLALQLQTPRESSGYHHNHTYGIDSSVSVIEVSLIGRALNSNKIAVQPKVSTGMSYANIAGLNQSNLWKKSGQYYINQNPMNVYSNIYMGFQPGQMPYEPRFGQGFNPAPEVSLVREIDPSLLLVRV